MAGLPLRSRSHAILPAEIAPRSIDLFHNKLRLARVRCVMLEDRRTNQPTNRADRDRPTVPTDQPTIDRPTVPMTYRAAIRGCILLG